jgi:hypothetical protein
MPCIFLVIYDFHAAPPSKSSREKREKRLKRRQEKKGTFYTTHIVLKTISLFLIIIMIVLVPKRRWHKVCKPRYDMNADYNPNLGQDPNTRYEEDAYCERNPHKTSRMCLMPCSGSSNGRRGITKTMMLSLLFFLLSSATKEISIVHLLETRASKAIEACFAVEAVLIVSLVVIDGGVVERAAVQTFPWLAADVAEGVAACAPEWLLVMFLPFILHILVGVCVCVCVCFSGEKRKRKKNLRDVIARFDQLNCYAADETRLIPLLDDHLLELLVFFIGSALVLCSLVREQHLAMHTCPLAALFCLANGICGFCDYILNM